VDSLNLLRNPGIFTACPDVKDSKIKGKLRKYDHGEREIHKSLETFLYSRK